MRQYRPALVAALAAALALPAVADAAPRPSFDQPNFAAGRPRDSFPTAGRPRDSFPTAGRPRDSFPSAGHPRDQDQAFRATVEGRSMTLPQLERRVVPRMNGADYLGPEFHGETYRLKFMRAGRVIWVDVDAATGQIVGKSGE